MKGTYRPIDGAAETFGNGCGDPETHGRGIETHGDPFWVNDSLRTAKVYHCLSLDTIAYPYQLLI